MSKIVFINDTHHGIKNDSPVFRNYMGKFYDDILFPYIEKNDIKTIVHMGDGNDRRRFSNFETLNYFRNKFIKPLEKLNITLHHILGNHDVYFRNSLEVNSMKEIYGYHPNVKIYDKFQDVEIDGFKFAVFPWINEENQIEFEDFLTKSSATIALGHFEIKGFQVLRGVQSEHGIDKDSLNTYEAVYSGHFHQKHDNGHIYYLGTQYDMTFADVNEKKGFHVFDTETKKLEFIENPYKIFHKIIYDEKFDIKSINFGSLKDCYVKIIVKKKPDIKQFDGFMDMIYNVNPAEVSVVEEMDLFINPTEEIDQTQDTVSLICKEIEGIDMTERIPALKKIANDLYNESYDVVGKDDSNDE